MDLNAAAALGLNYQFAKNADAIIDIEGTATSDASFVATARDGVW
jgi:hypothetical protein